MELKFTGKLGTLYPYKEFETPFIGKVELWDLSKANLNEESRREALCLVASLSYGNNYCKNPEKLYNFLIERGHESVFEFIRFPVKEGETYRKTGISNSLRNEYFETYEEKGKKFEGNIVEELIKWHKSTIATFKLKVPIFVARQIMRHRSFAYLEMSRRYVRGDKVKFEFFVPKEVIKAGLKEEYLKTAQRSVELYNKMIEKGIKPEKAREILPLSLYTEFWLQGDYLGLLNFFVHRLFPEAQEETRLVAFSMLKLLEKHQPEIINTMKEKYSSWIKKSSNLFFKSREDKINKLKPLLEEKDESEV